MELAALIPIFVTLFVVIDPIGLVPIFVALTAGMTARERRNIALRACLIGLLVLTLFGLFGEAVLGFVGISMGAFRIAGGLLLFLTALEMLFSKRRARRENEAEESREDPSVFPLATPPIAGPGAIASMILLINDGGWVEVATVHAVMASVVALTFLLFQTAGTIERLLGPTGVNVVTRLLGMLLAALAVQFVLDGLSEAMGLTF